MFNLSAGYGKELCARPLHQQWGEHQITEAVPATSRGRHATGVRGIKCQNSSSVLNPRPYHLRSGTRSRWYLCPPMGPPCWRSWFSTHPRTHARAGKRTKLGSFVQTCWMVQVLQCSALMARVRVRTHRRVLGCVKARCKCLYSWSSSSWSRIRSWGKQKRAQL